MTSLSAFSFNVNISKITSMYLFYCWFNLAVHSACYKNVVTASSAQALSLNFEVTLTVKLCIHVSAY